MVVGLSNFPWLGTYGWLHSLHSGIGRWFCSLLCFCLLIRSEHPVYGLLSLSGFYCSFHLGSLPLCIRHTDDLIYWVLRTQISYIFRANNRIDWSETASHSTCMMVPRTREVLSEKMAGRDLLMTFLPWTVSCSCQYCPNFIEHNSRKCNIPWSQWHCPYPACHSLRTGHMTLKKCMTRAQSSHCVPGFCSLSNLFKNYPFMCPAWARQGLDHLLIFFISCSLMNSIW